MDNKYIMMYRVKKYLKIFSFALLFLLIGLLIFEYIRIKPKDVNFTNITSSSVSVSWTTKSALPGVVLVEEQKSLIPINILGIGKEKSYDTRDATKAELEATSLTSDNAIEKGIDTLNIEDFEEEIVVKEKGDYYTHHVVVSGLDPEKEYSFKVGDNLLFTSAKDSKVKTLPTPEGIVTPEPAYGTIKDAQDREGIPINLHSPVTDAIVYLNFLDNETGKKSNVFSSSVNSSGNWYMDVSGAVDDQGNPFLETYDSVNENIFVEILIDAGPLGKWKKIDSGYWITPTPISVLNLPSAIQDKGVVGSLIKVDDEEVKGVFLNTVNAGFIECDSTCGAWDLSANKCICPTGMNVNSVGACVCASGTVQTSTCTCTTPTTSPTPSPIVQPPPPPVCGGKAIFYSNSMVYSNLTGIAAIESYWREKSYCSVGNPSSKPNIPSEGTSVSWRCVSGEASVTCTARREGAALVPACGSYAKNFEPDITKWEGVTGSFCSIGNVLSTPAFPAEGASVSWTCNLDAKTVQCSASRSAADKPTILPSKATCTHLITWCGDCYYKNENDKYVICDQSLCTKPIECSKTTPSDQESYTCGYGSVLNKSCTLVNNECKRCEWAMIGTSNGPKWVNTDEENCEGIGDQQVKNCANYDAMQSSCIEPDGHGTWLDGECLCSSSKNLILNSDGECICPSNLDWDEQVGKCIFIEEKEPTTLICNTSTKGEFCDDPHTSVCSSKNTCVKINSTCAENSKWNSQGECIKDVDTSSECRNVGQQCKVSNTLATGYCNSSNECVANNTECIPLNLYSGDARLGYIYEYNFGICKKTDKCLLDYEKNINGVCVKRVSPPPSSDEFCWEEGLFTSLLRIPAGDQEIMACYKGDWIDTVITPQYQDCLNIAKNVNSTDCSHTVGNQFCYVESTDKLYQCIRNKWTLSESSNGEVVATKLLVMNAGEECKGSPECICNNSVEDRVKEGQICHTLAKQINARDKCSLSEAEKERQATEECQCIGGEDNGKTVKEGNYCRELDYACSADDTNKVCRSDGATCIPGGGCTGDIDITYIAEKKTVKAGVQCILEEKNGVYTQCICDGGEDDKKMVYDNQWCRDVGIFGCDKEGDVCSKDGDVCKLILGYDNQYMCVEKESFNNQNKPLLSFSDMEVLAQTDSTVSEYIIDSQTGMFSDIRAGSYLFEHDNQYFAFTVSEADLIAGNGSVLIYIDVNENGKYDEGTDTKVSDLASTVNIVALEQKFTYKLEQGFNFISIPFLISNEESRTAAGLLQKLNSVYGDSIYSISKYDGKWRVVGQNSQVYDNNDFQLIPGQGYIVKSKKRMEISLVGKPVQFESSTDNANITLFQGWNLIGMYGTNVKQYTAKSLIQGINASNNPKFTANNVTNWESDVQRYDGFQLDVENGVEIEYGFDFPIKFLQGYFIRVTEGQGNWQPELR